MTLYKPAKFYFLLMGIFLGSFSTRVLAQIEMQADLQDNKISEFFINEIYYSDTGTSPLLFKLAINNATSKELNISIRLTLFFQETGKSKTKIVYGQTGEFKSVPGISVLTNQQLFSKSDKRRLLQLIMNDVIVEKINKSIYTTGEIPLGTYEFELSALDASSNKIIQTYNLLIERTTPIDIQLKSPGGLVNYGDIHDTYLPQPLFIWSSDATSFQLKIWKVTSPNESADDIIKNEPLFVTRTDQTIFQYPISGVPTLKSGNTYYWQVVATGHTLDGVMDVASEVRGFRLQEFAGGDKERFQYQLSVYLKMLIGDEKYQDYFGDSGSLNQFTATGTITRNDSTVNMSALNELINKLITGEIKINQLKIE